MADTWQSPGAHLASPAQAKLERRADSIEVLMNDPEARPQIWKRIAFMLEALDEAFDPAGRDRDRIDARAEPIGKV